MAKHMIELKCVVELDDGFTIDDITGSDLTASLCTGLSARGVPCTRAAGYLGERAVFDLSRSMAPDVKRKAKRLEMR